MEEEGESGRERGLTLSKGEGGGEGDGELGSSSDAAMHLLRPVLGTLRLCSNGLIVVHN